MRELTDRQREIYNFILSFKNEHGYAPSIREIAKGNYISIGTAHRYIGILIDKGYIEYVPKISRAIVLRTSV